MAFQVVMTDVVVPGGRDVRGTLSEVDADRAVVACPPHPQYGGDRRDARLRSIDAALERHDIACLRIDYGQWASGRGEQADAVAATEWLGERFESVGLCGYSFGAAVAIRAPAEVAATVAVAPPAGLIGTDDVVTALEEVSCPLLVCYGERDDTVDWQPVVERARELEVETIEFASGHFFGGCERELADEVATFLDRTLS